MPLKVLKTLSLMGFLLIHLSLGQILSNLRNETTIGTQENITVNLNVQADTLTQQNVSVNAVVLASYPLQLDYSTLGLISDDSKVIDFCDSSWAIAAAYLYEYYLRTRNYRSYVSEQAIMQCTTYYAPNRRRSDCSGGHFQDALKFLSVAGAVSKINYPESVYSFDVLSDTAPNSPICTDKNRLFMGEGTVKTYHNLTTPQIKTILAQKGPLLVQIYASLDFIRYVDGSFTQCQQNTGNKSNLVVMLFGYKGDQYWLIKAPFGKQWGYMGSMKVSMGCKFGSKMGQIQYSSESQTIENTFDPTLFYSPETGQSSSTSYEFTIQSLPIILVFGLLLLIQ